MQEGEWSVSDNLIEDFNRYFPTFAEHVKWYRSDHTLPLELIFYLDDDTMWLFDDTRKSIRKIAKNSECFTEEEYREEVSRRLQKYMFIREWTQVELAEATRLSQQRISTYIACRSTMSIYTAYRIIEALHCPSDLLIF